MLYVIAERLGRRIPEMLEMSVSEYAGWVAYLRVLKRGK
jgi:hypothetical protein